VKCTIGEGSRVREG